MKGRNKKVTMTLFNKVGQRLDVSRQGKLEQGDLVNRLITNQ